MRYARIVDGVVVEVITWSPEGRYPADWVWVECPPETVQRSIFDGETWTHPDPQPEPTPQTSLEIAQAAMLGQIAAKVTALLDAGAPIEHEGQTLHIALDDASRADVGGMATTALAALSEAVPWPTSYATGWITIENVRIPMPTPADGLMLAAQVGDHYASIKQNGRDLKDAVLAAEDNDDLDDIDVNSGWPA